MHRLHVHVKRLVTAGHKVGVVRQIETAALKAAGDNRNAPFVRKLTNLYTKGTYIDDVEGIEGLAAAAGGASPATGYMLCITETNAKGWGNDERVHVGVVAVQPATGDVIYDDFEDGFMRSEIETRLLHIAPCEILIVGEMSKASEKLVRHLSGSKMNVFGDAVRLERTPKKKTAAAEAHTPDPALIFNSGEALIAAATAGLGLVQVAEYYARPALNAGALVELLPDFKAHAYDISVVFQQRKSISPRLRVFIDFLVEIFSPPPW